MTSYCAKNRDKESLIDRVSLRLSSCFLLLLYCFRVKGLGTVANSADDIINDMSEVFSTSAVFNASFYNVYYQWFGPGVRLHLGMAKKRFLELAMKKKMHVNDEPKVDRYK